VRTTPLSSALDEATRQSYTLDMAIVGFDALGDVDHDLIDLTAWIGTVVVVENVVSSLSSSHLFDFVHGWLYVLGVGIVGGMAHGNCQVMA
jgi:hypothetical protein